MILELFVKKKVEAQKQLNKGKIQQNIMLSFISNINRVFLKAPK